VVATLLYAAPKIWPRSPTADGVELALGDVPTVASEVQATGVQLAKAYVHAAHVLTPESLLSMAEPQVLLSKGLAEQATVRAFFGTIAKPWNLPRWGLHTSGAFTALEADSHWSQTAVHRLAGGFEFVNSIGFWLEVAGVYAGYMYGYVSSFGLLDGLSLGATATMVAVAVEVLVALLVSYLFYWMVRQAGASYRLVAISAYLALGAANLLYAASCLWGGLELLHAAVYTLKTATALACAFLAAKIHLEAEAGGESFVHVDTADAAATTGLPEPSKLPAPDLPEHHKELL